MPVTAPTINSSTPATNTTNTSASVTPPATQAGLASVPNSISFSISCCGGPTRYFTGVLDFFRWCLAQLPLIGRLFAQQEREAVAPPQQPSINPIQQTNATETLGNLQNQTVTSSVPQPVTTETGSNEQSQDERDYKEVACKFIDTRGTPDFHYLAHIPSPIRELTVLHTPTWIDLDRTLLRFRQIQDPFYKMAAFRLVVVAENSTHEIVQRFYNALPENLKAEFRENINLVNGQREQDPNEGVLYVSRSGREHVVATNMRNLAVIQAADNIVTTRRQQRIANGQRADLWDQMSAMRRLPRVLDLNVQQTTATGTLSNERCSDERIYEMIARNFIGPVTPNHYMYLRITASIHYMIDLRPPLPPQIDLLLDQFRQIQDPFYKMAAFRLTIVAINTTADIARQFYDALPDPLKAEFRANICLVNGQEVDPNDGIQYATRFGGEHAIARNIRSLAASEAIDNIVTTKRQQRIANGQRADLWDRMEAMRRMPMPDDLSSPPVIPC